ncbi:MAG: macro domain-containing protein [Verrucomicrobia bacterium]|nr:macro domain-containing protein [Verrucomicrobiota bacterium]
MIKVLIGNLFESQAQTWVNTVNCVGVMGKGVALEFKKRFPDMFEDYVARCARGEVRLGRPYLYKRTVLPWILNFPTKHHWREVANLQAIEQGLVYLRQYYRQWGITSLAVPPLGCGQGQLEWRIVGPTLYRHLAALDIPVELYAPHGTPHEELQPSFLGRLGEEGDLPVAMPEPQWIRPEWVALVEILQRIEVQPYHWPVGRTAFQRLAYVASEEGLNTGLEYTKGSYGPFCSEVKRLIGRLQNHGLIHEERLGRMFHVRVGTTYADARKAYEAALQKFEPIIAKVADLFVRLNSQQAELVATVLFAARELRQQQSSIPSETDVLAFVIAWKQKRRPPLTESEVALTIRQLGALGWLNVKPSKKLPLPEPMAAAA